MWIMLNNAFISVVDKAPNPDQLVVRARVEGHIEAVFPQAKVITDTSGDYMFRAFIDRVEVAEAMRLAVMNIDYPNFKNSIKDDRFHDACSSVWGVMSRLQPVRPYSGRTSRNYDMFGAGRAGSAGKTSTRAKKDR